jgi:hypothetical protein
MDSLTHTFGGSALDRHVFDFETAIEPTEADMAEGLDPTPAADPAPGPGGVQPVEAGCPPISRNPRAGSPQIDWSDPTATSRRTRWTTRRARSSRWSLRRTVGTRGQGETPRSHARD